MKKKVEELEKRIVTLEEKVQAQPSVKEIISNITTEIKKSLKEINL